MANPDLDLAMQEAYSAFPDDLVYLDTLEIDHPSFTEPIRVVRDWQPFTAGALTFQPYPFDFKLPAITPGQVPKMQVTIDNVTSEIGKALHDAVNNSTGAVTLLYRQYVKGEIDANYTMPVPMVIQSVTLTRTTVQALCSFPDLVNTRFPNEFYTINRFPGLVR